MPECMFSGEEPDNEEHVIPRWLQSRYNLWTETLFIPNATRLQYRYVKVPVRSSDNTRFGEIENRISQGLYDPREVYLWALKIHIGLLFRDASLKFDRSIPDSPMIWDMSNFAAEVQAFRMHYGVWAANGKFDPNPLGTVHILDALTPEPEFDLVHDAWSGTVVVQLGDKLIYVSLWDQGDGYYANLLQSWHHYHEPNVHNAPAEQKARMAHAAHRVWACETSYWLWRQRRGFNFVASPDSFTLIPPLFRRQGKPSEEAQLGQFCRTFGLRLRKFTGEVGNHFETVMDARDP
jgi:hypothetical protein